MIPFIPTPWKIGAALFAAVALASAAGAYHHHVYEQGDTAGFQRRDAQAKRDEAAIEAQVAERYSTDLASAKAETAQLKYEADVATVARQKERDSHEADIQTHVTAALIGAERMRVPGTTSASGAIRSETTAAGAGTGPSASSTEGAYLLPDTAAAIYRIAGDDWQLVQDYNALLERFNSCRVVANASD
jgi:hypothetical protein